MLHVKPSSFSRNRELGLCPEKLEKEAYNKCIQNLAGNIFKSHEFEIGSWNEFVDHAFFGRYFAVLTHDHLNIWDLPEGKSLWQCPRRFDTKMLYCKLLINDQRLAVEAGTHHCTVYSKGKISAHFETKRMIYTTLNEMVLFAITEQESSYHLCSWGLKGTPLSKNPLPLDILKKNPSEDICEHIVFAECRENILIYRTECEKIRVILATFASGAIRIIEFDDPASSITVGSVFAAYDFLYISCNTMEDKSPRILRYDLTTGVQTEFHSGFSVGEIRNLIVVEYRAYFLIEEDERYTICLLDLASNKQKVLHQSPFTENFVEFSLNGHLLAVNHRSVLKIVDTSDGQKLYETKYSDVHSVYCNSLLAIAITNKENMRVIVQNYACQK